jgi:hypothetical protein
VSSERLIDISVREDKGPEAELTVKYLRKVGNEYWITPKAMIPFENASSFARDELGLRTVRYYFTWRKVESQIIGQGRAQITLGLAQAVAAPFATLATPLTFSAYDRIINTYAAVSEKGLQTGSLDVGGFTENYERLPKRTLAELKKVLDVATLPQDLPADVRTYSFGSLTDVFDLGEETPGTPKLLQKDAIEAQPRYQIELFLEATDTNASVQTPSTTNPGQMVVGKVTRSLTPVRFLVVAEEDLFVKITEDEEKIGNTCENALKRAEDAQNKLLPELSQLGQLNVDPMQLESSAVRVIGILQDVGRVRDECQTMQADIVRVMNELDYNRFGQAAMNKWRNEYFESVRGLLSTEVPNAQSALNNFQTKLATNQPPTNVDISETRKAMTDLVAALVRTRKLFGDLESLQSKIKQLNTILNQQKEIQKEIADAKRRTEEELRQPKIFVDKQMTIKAGQKTTLTLPVQWGFYIAPKGELGIRVEPAPGSELKTPARIIAKDDRDDYKLEIEAGQKLGVTTIILTPDVGKPAELRVEVVK